MTGRRRLQALQYCVEDVLDNHNSGDFVETGAWRGGSVIFIRALMNVRNITDRVVRCANSFDDMPVLKKPISEYLLQLILVIVSTLG